MHRVISLPNSVTVIRMLLVFVVVILAFSPAMFGRLLAAFLAVLTVVGDWLDGYLARKLHQSTTIGSILDLAADRIIENVLWILLASLQLIPIWIPIVVVSRGILTDGIRNYALSLGRWGFGERSLHRSVIGQFITGSPVMRTGYALIKGFSFGWLLLWWAIAVSRVSLASDGAAFIHDGFAVGYWAAVLAAVICVVRGIPVIVEGIGLIRRANPDG